MHIKIYFENTPPFINNLQQKEAAFQIIRASGGLVFNEKGETLFIFRKGKWDLPKGKLDEGESLEACAVREVEEETGLKNIKLGKLLTTTYHTYEENGARILKESHWYKMEVTGHQELIPQTEEGITEIRWVDREDWEEILKDSFPLIKEVTLKV